MGNLRSPIEFFWNDEKSVKMGKLLMECQRKFGTLKKGKVHDGRVGQRCDDFGRTHFLNDPIASLNYHSFPRIIIYCS